MYAVVVSCEHAGNAIPIEYERLFRSSEARAALASHRGWDPGSAPLARTFAEALVAPLLEQPVSRLLVECNRSLEHPALWSEFSATLSDAERHEVVEKYWRPHRDAVRKAVDDALAGATVVHVGVHTFTPVWKGRARSTDIGILYDPRRAGESALASRWRTEMVAGLNRPLTVHLNRPYRGWTDGLTTSLRSVLPAGRYLGIELEVNQALARGPRTARPAALGAALCESLRRTLDALFV